MSPSQRDLITCHPLQLTLTNIHTAAHKNASIRQSCKTAGTANTPSTLATVFLHIYYLKATFAVCFYTGFPSNNCILSHIKINLTSYFLLPYTDSVFYSRRCCMWLFRRMERNGICHKKKEQNNLIQNSVFQLASVSAFTYLMNE